MLGVIFVLATLAATVASQNCTVAVGELNQAMGVIRNRTGEVANAQGRMYESVQELRDETDIGHRVLYDRLDAIEAQLSNLTVSLNLSITKVNDALDGEAGSKLIELINLVVTSIVLAFQGLVKWCETKCKPAHKHGEALDLQERMFP